MGWGLKDTSIKTRIETKYILKIPPCQVFVSKILPLKQGLKHYKRGGLHDMIISLKDTSIKTRIETR